MRWKQCTRICRARKTIVQSARQKQNRQLPALLCSPCHLRFYWSILSLSLQTHSFIGTSTTSTRWSNTSEKNPQVKIIQLLFRINFFFAECVILICYVMLRIDVCGFVGHKIFHRGQELRRVKKSNSNRWAYSPAAPPLGTKERCGLLQLAPRWKDRSKLGRTM